MPAITMINDVCPQDYNLEGQQPWCESVQWKAGQTYDCIDSDIARLFVRNGDAVYDKALEARDVERKMKVNNLITAINMGIL